MNMKKSKIYLRDGRAPIPTKELTSRIMSSIKSKNTKPELMLRKALWHNGIKGYRLHWNKVPGRPDIVFPKKKIAVFVNGCYWHSCPYCKPPTPKTHSDFWREKFERNVKRDFLKIKLLNNEGWRTLTIWECQLKKNIIQCVDSISVQLNVNLNNS